MTDVSTKLNLPFVRAAQAQKHVIINEAFLRLDALVQASVVSRSVAAQPAAPADGALYVLPAGKTGADWAAMGVGALAYHRDGVWEQVIPRAGWVVFVANEALLVFYTGAAWTSINAALGQTPPAHLSGLTLSNNAVDSANDIDIAVGVARADNDGADLLLAGALTKRLDAVWSVGSNQGGLDTGSKAASTWYYLWLIKRLDTGIVDALFSASATAPSLPTSYSAKRRIGAVRTDGAGNIRAFTQHGDDFTFVTPVLDVSVTNLGTSSAAYTLSVPPGMRARARLVATQAAAGSVLVRPTTETDVVPNVAGGASLATVLWTAGWYALLTMAIDADSASQVAARSTLASTTLWITTLGWVDWRGRV